MKRAPRRPEHRGTPRIFPLLLLGLVLLVSADAGAQGTTLYVTRILTAETGGIALGDLVRASGDVPPEARETLARSVAVVSDKVLLVPASLYREQLESVFGMDSIIVGARTIVVPRGMLPEEETYLLTRLADYLSTQGLIGASCMALSIVQYQLKGNFPTDGNPLFQAAKGANGSVEVSYSLTGSGGGSVSGRVSFIVPVADSGSADGVRSGTPVRVIFHKGPITIEIPGKATASAAVGGRVGVYVADSQRSFVGRVVDAKAVEVELP